MFAVDTNILVYAHFDQYPQHEKARAFCDHLLASQEEWCLGWQVIYEYIRITTHPAIHREPLSIGQALADLEPYLSAETVHLLSHTAQHRPVLEALAKVAPTARGNFVHDVHYAALLKEHGIALIFTADTDFHRFPFLEVIDPTA